MDTKEDHQAGMNLSKAVSKVEWELLKEKVVKKGVVKKVQWEVVRWEAVKWKLALIPSWSNKDLHGKVVIENDYWIWLERLKNEFLFLKIT